MTYKEALYVLQDVYNGVSIDDGKFKECVEVIFANSRKVEHLQTEIGQLKTKIKNKNRIIRTTENHNNRLRNDNQAKKEVLEKRNNQIDKLREALEFYADKSNYITTHHDLLGECLPEIIYDDGHNARQTLEELK